MEGWNEDIVRDFLADHLFAINGGNSFSFGIRTLWKLRQTGRQILSRVFSHQPASEHPGSDGSHDNEHGLYAEDGPHGLRHFSAGRKQRHSRLQHRPGVATLTMGITDNLEFGAKGKFIATDLGSSLTREQGFGDTEVALKWRIRNQSEEGTIPAIALGIGGIIPTGDSAKGFERSENKG